MDYSLLLTLEQNDDMDYKSCSRNIIVSRDRYMIYHVAIIDYLQNWSIAKKLEWFYKTKILMKSGKLISAVNPLAYQ